MDQEAADIRGPLWATEIAILKAVDRGLDPNRPFRMETLPCFFKDRYHVRFTQEKNNEQKQ